MRQTGDALPIVSVDDIRKFFRTRGSTLFRRRSPDLIHAVDGVSFTMTPHETFSLVGETGCGKTTTARMILKLTEPTSGRIAVQGQWLDTLHGPELRRHRRTVQAVFQDPWSSLDPRMRVRDLISEPLIENERLAKAEVRERIAELLDAVGLAPAVMDDYPHEFSGGQRQRVAIARALILRPQLVVLDEPVSALDVSIRAQIMNLLKDIQDRLGTAYLLIAHDLATVGYMSHRVAVMYLGQIVESAAATELLGRPLHPYTKALVSAALPARPGRDHDDVPVGGELPSPINPPSGCRFRTRCPYVFDRCIDQVPPLRELIPGHTVACHLY